MFSGAFKLVVSLGLISAVVSILPERAPLYSVLIQFPQNTSLCVRTIAYEWEGAQMTLVDCERTYQFYDGEKYHTAVQYAGFEGVKFETMWAPAPTAFGISGCFYPLDGKIRAVSCYNDVPQEFWNVTELNSQDSIYQLQSVSTGKCIAVPEVNDKVALVEAACNATDPLQQLKFTRRNEK